MDENAPECRMGIAHQLNIPASELLIKDHR
jgi:hypothetical protein